MPTFRYSISGSASAAATIDAPDRAAALRLILQRGQTPVRIDEVSGPDVEATPAAGVARGSMSREHLANLIRDLATAVTAGLALVPSLRTIARQGRSPSQRAMLEYLIDQVEHGRPLSDAMADYGKPFTDLLVSLVRAGEMAGRLGEVLSQAAKLLDREVKLRKSLMGAMLYPAIIAGAVVIAVVIVVAVIVPRVLAAVSTQLRVLPWPTRIVQGTAEFVGTWWWLIALVIAGAAWGAGRLYSKPQWRLRIDGALLRLPAVGGALRDVAVARFTRTLATLIGAGLPVVMSLRITRGTLGNALLAQSIDGVCEEVQAGRTIAEPLEKTGHFPPLLVQIVGLGEQTGKLDEVLTQAATAFEDRTEQSIKVLTTVLPPILIVTLACIVGFVVLSILLPLIELQESIG